MGKDVSKGAAHGQAGNPCVLKPDAVGAHRLAHLIDQPKMHHE